MIKVINTTSAVIVNGHAHDGGGMITKDELRACEAVTALCFTLIAGMLDVLKTDPIYDLEKGYFAIVKDGMTKEEILLTDVFLNGLRALADRYTQEIKIDDQA